MALPLGPPRAWWSGLPASAAAAAAPERAAPGAEPDLGGAGAAEAWGTEILCLVWALADQ